MNGLLFLSDSVIPPHYIMIPDIPGRVNRVQVPGTVINGGYPEIIYNDAAPSGCQNKPGAPITWGVFGIIDMLVGTGRKQQYINVNSAAAFRRFTDELHARISNALAAGSRSVVFLCIGTDRSTGDSLGTLIGYKLSGLKTRNVHVYGTLENPVHARNLDEVMKRVEADCHKPFVIAIDACLGSMEHVGYISVGEGPIKPGSGVNKELAPVGDMFVTGIVNFGGFMDFLILQNTRLHVVMRMADLIAAGIRFVIWKLGEDGLLLPEGAEAETAGE